ncbi:DUF2231 domain-containing protein [Nocardia australiensis]|uniref:DUF2231 domain-containing protein n=1 Tax=Nocardia australiensis TaxID=2887191 RepID=UPI0027DF1B6F|nr:DUF2231 domain-containing protein [Nocardia australiensis]
MSTINGLPAHVLLVHVIVIFVPLTSVLLILAALWPAVRRRLVWLVVVLAAITVALVPLTTDAGEALEHRIGASPAIEKHSNLGDDMIYFVVPLLLVAAVLLVVQLREQREKRPTRAVAVVIALLAIAAGVAATVQVYRVGESGSRAVWGAQVESASDAVPRHLRLPGVLAGHTERVALLEAGHARVAESTVAV